MNDLIVLTMLIPFVAGHVFGVLLGQQATAFIELLMVQTVVRPPLAGFLVESLR